jgi:hypothetical protein
MTCRECLRAKPLNAFPDPSRRRCADCGGQCPGAFRAASDADGSPRSGRQIPATPPRRVSGAASIARRLPCLAVPLRPASDRQSRGNVLRR